MAEDSGVYGCVQYGNETANAWLKRAVAEAIRGASGVTPIDRRDGKTGSDSVRAGEGAIASTFLVDEES